MTPAEQTEVYQKLIDFLNSCITKPEVIKLRDIAVPKAFEDYKIKDSDSAISFILNRIEIIGICKKQRLGYGNNSKLPFVYEYVFRLKNESNNIGCLAFYNNPKQKNKIKIIIKSLHKDYQDVIPNQTNKNLEIVWLKPEQIKALPISNGEE